MNENVFISVFGQNLPEVKNVEEELKKLDSFKKNDLDKLPEYAAAVAKHIKVTSTQLRRFYTYVKGIEQANRLSPSDATDASRGFIDKYKLRFLLPKLAGSSERDSLRDLYKIFAVAIPKINDVEDLRLFVEFFEAILDYHSTLNVKNKDE